MVKCPNCGKENTKTEKEWDYSVFHVKSLICQNCKKLYKAYYKDEKFSHTIPKAKK